MNTFFSHFFLAALIHGACIALLIYSPGKTKHLKLHPFKEKLVFIHEPPTPVQSTQSTAAQKHETSIPQSPPKKQTKNSSENKPISTPPKDKEKPKCQSQQKERLENTTKQVITQNKQLKTIADLTKKLSDHLEDSSSHLNLALPKHDKMPLPISETQEEELCQLLREYIVLPISGEIRLKLILTPQGRVYECVILSPISEAEKQFILTRMSEIPFTKFLDKYKISKNIVFHIKLLSNES